MLSAGLNLGEADLKQPGLPDLLSEATRREGLPKTALAIEITETAVSASNLNEVLAMLTEIRARGMFVALDDFGTGASSLTFLKTLPCTSLKIDKSFVQDCLTDPMAMAIVRALTTLGHDMRLKIIAKGVETAAQRDALAAIGIDLMQGYFYARPIPSADTDAYIAAMPVAGPSRASGSVA